MGRHFRKGLVIGMVLILIAVVFTAIPTNISAAAPPIIYINADGTISPPSAPISKVGDVYTLTADANNRIYIRKSGIRLDGDGYTLYGGTYEGHGNNIRDCNSVIVEDITVKEFYFGIYIYESDSNTIRFCKVEDNKWDGIRIYNSEYNSVIFNDVSGSERGITLDVADANSIKYNSVNSCVSGIRVDGDSNIIYKNSVKNNHVGIGLTADYNVIKDNMAADNLWFGIHMNDADFNVLEDNIMMRANMGIYLLYSDGNTLICNGIIKNNIGIKLQNSYKNRFHHNNIIHNVDQLEMISTVNVWDDGAGEGNYWSDYAGVDLDSDGVGDTLLPHQGVDNYPLMAPCCGFFTIDYVIEVVEDLELPAGIENSLISKLNNALKSLEKGNIQAAMNQLEAFINEVEAQKGKKISEEDAELLIEAAMLIMETL
ncbi:MAG: right-handed parallel beta-helix repeat-containing protein [Thermoplasmata archaeon]|nr:MAG: right-handed parallel beta-helix repeat-containing protein [Thermoplasmata archaeon]